VTDEEWWFVTPYLALCREDAAQRDYALRRVFNGLRSIAKTGNQWRFMQGYTGDNAAQAAEKHCVQLEAVKHTEAKRGLVLLPRR